MTSQHTQLAPWEGWVPTRGALVFLLVLALGLTATACSDTEDPAPRRILIEPTALLGDSPIDNRVADPFFRLDTRAWEVLQVGTDGSLYHALHGILEHRGVPGGIDRALVVEAGEVGVPVIAGILTRLGAGTRLNASLWLGMELDSSDTLPSSLAYLTGQHLATGELQSVRLFPTDEILETECEPRLAWRRFAASIPAGFGGEGMLWVNVPSFSPARLYIAMPVVVPEQGMAENDRVLALTELSPAPPFAGAVLGRLRKPIP